MFKFWQTHPTYLLWHQHLQKFMVGKRVKIVDYGCGNGIIVDIFGPSRFSEYIGFDVSRSAITEANKKYGRDKHLKFKEIIPESLPKFGTPETQDLVIMIGVLQYLTDREIEHVLTESYRVLKPGGKLIFSTVLDIPFYRYINVYRFVFPNRYIGRQKTEKLIHKIGFRFMKNYARGLIVGPLISHALVIPFDAVDHFIFRVKGKIGFLGKCVRTIFFPLMYLELLLPLDFGYTWYVIAEK